MGWANCGTDSKGRPIGYAHAATCDHPECDRPIDRGLSYACGDMHGQNEYDCPGYFCGAHLVRRVIDGRTIWLCAACSMMVPESEEEARCSGSD